MYRLLPPRAFGRDFDTQMRNRIVSQATTSEFFKGAAVRIESANRRVDMLSEVFLDQLLE